MADTALCTVAQVKAVLGVASDETSEDAKLAALISLASAQIRSYCRRDFAAVTVTAERYDGDGSAMLTLASTPILEVTALAIDGQAVGLAEVKVYPSYIRFEDSGEYNPRLRASCRVFPAGALNVSVSYRAGFAAVPADIANACVLQTVHLLNTVPKLGIVSETSSVAQATTAYSQGPLTPAARIVCNRYCRAEVIAV